MNLRATSGLRILDRSACDEERMLPCILDTLKFGIQGLSMAQWGLSFQVKVEE